MIISHKHKFIFVKTRKTAGTSVEIALSKICGKGDIITPINLEDERYRHDYAGLTAQNYFIPLSKYSREDIIWSLAKRKRKKFYNHMPLSQIKRYVSEDVWNNYYKFTIERSPFDKIISLYFWRKGNKRFAGVYDFIKNGGLEHFDGYDLYSVNGVVKVDAVYRYEDLNYMCKDLTHRLKLSNPLQMPPYKAKSKHRTVREPESLLDQDSISLMEIIFAREIKLFGYKSPEV